MVYTLQLLHAADQEAGVPALDDAPRFSAVLNALRAQDLDNDEIAGFANTLTLSSGDAYIPGLFFSSSFDVFGGSGQADILIQNELGFQAIAFGNHEFDRETTVVRNLITGTGSFPGTAFPYLSSNLDFSTDSNLAGLVVPDGQAPQPNSIAASVVIDVNGEKIGVVGATTPTITSISSPGNITVLPGTFGGSPSAAELDALAAVIQADVNALLLANPDVNKVVLLAHMQQIAIEQELADRLENVDIIVAGGSNTRLLDEDDRVRAGDTTQGVYPIIRIGADGNPVAVVNTDGNYKYVGRLVIDFDDNGVILPESYDPMISGAYATDAQGVTDLNAESFVDPEIQAIVDALRTIIVAKESNVFGVSDVYLEGLRPAVRQQETNLGNLTADANLAIAQAVDPTTVISIKNGGGIRDDIGRLLVPTGGTGAVDRLPNEAVTDADGAVVKPTGGISETDIANALSFNNGLSLITLTATELLAVIEHGVAASTIDNQQGRFPQVSGLKFSFDLDAPAGDRIQSLAVVDETGRAIDVIVRNGELVGVPTRTFRVATLGFLAGGGDGYPFPTGPSLNRVDLNQAETAPRTGAATFAPDGSEQDALAEYLAANFATTPYTLAETERGLDNRIQNLDFRADAVLSTLTPVGTYRSGQFDASAAEITAYDPISQRLFITNALTNTVDIVDLSNPQMPMLISSIDLSPYGGGVNSVAVTESNGAVIVGVAVENDVKILPGQAVFFDVDGNFLNAVTVGSLPDMITFTPDGLTALVANEGEPNDDYTIDPDGSISIIKLADSSVRTVSFRPFNTQLNDLRAAGVRIFGPNATVAQDLEPEYIAVSPDGTTAWVTLQENNAIAVVDLATATVTAIRPLGLKDFSASALDASDRDVDGTSASGGRINIQPWPVFGMYQPDSITSFQIGGTTYYATANEGDARDYDGYSEEARIGSLTLDPVVFPNAATLQANQNLGRLNSTTAGGDTDGDGDQDRLLTYGARSFSIWDAAGNLVFDSGDDFEQITAARLPDFFNATNDANNFDNRSDDKGPEPEAIAVGVVNNRTYAFVGLERVGGIMVYDVTNPSQATFVDYVNNRDFSGNPEADTAGDLGPEDIKFVSGLDSPTGSPLILVANEVSGSVTLYDFNPNVAIGNNQDFNTDGFTDIVWRNQRTGSTVVWFMDDNNRRIGFDLPIQVDNLNWEIQGVADFNGDGQADLLWRNQATGQNSLWFMDGVELASTAILPTVADRNWSIQGTGDFNNDGQVDLLWRNQATGVNSVWVMNGSTFVEGFTINPIADRNWQAGGVGDFDGDGYNDDIVWRNYATGQNAVWYMDSTTQRAGSVALLTPIADTNWVLQGVSDLDGDGTKDDLLWRQEATGVNAVWYMQGNTFESGATLETVAGGSGWTSIV